MILLQPRISPLAIQPFDFSSFLDGSIHDAEKLRKVKRAWRGLVEIIISRVHRFVNVAFRSKGEGGLHYLQECSKAGMDPFVSAEAVLDFICQIFFSVFRRRCSRVLLKEPTKVIWI